MIDARDDAVALEARRVAERGILECHGALALGVQCFNLLSDRGRSPGGQLSVELVAAGRHGERRLGLEVGLEKVIAEGCPAVVPCGRRRSCSDRRRRRGGALAGRNANCKQRHEHDTAVA